MTCSLNSPFFSQSTGSGVLVAGGYVLLFEIQSYMHRLQPSRDRSENNQAKTIIIYFLSHYSLKSPNNVGNQGHCSGSALASHLWGLLIPGFEGYSQSLSVFLPPQTDDVPCLWSLSLERMFRGIDNIWRFICWWWSCVRGRYIIPYLAVVSSDEQPSSREIMFLYKFNSWHESCNSNVVGAML